MQTLAFWVLLLVFMGAFAVQVARRVQLIAAAPNTFSLDHLGTRTRRFVVDVLLQHKTIAERPLTGLMHAFVFWGFVAFGGYTLVEFLCGLGIVDLTHTRWFEAYRLLLMPFAVAVLVGILYLLIRRALVHASRARQGEGQAGKPPLQGDLVKCALCGTHLPLAEARAVGDRLYCSDEHARLGPGRN